mmetsp:Transcript_17618/g.28509  ORF Transcript_17618/g.28509 Transcript_17618/m.28509 type:complete len:293 (-) Transcript_17618:847-1725(-)
MDSDSDGPLSDAPVNVRVGGASVYTPQSIVRPIGYRGTDHCLLSSDDEAENHRRQKKPISHRKARRKEHTLRVGAQVPIPETDLTDENDEFDVDKASKIIFHQEWSSCFDGFTNEMRTAFLESEDGFTCSKVKRPVIRPANDARGCFSKVEHSLRHHLVETGTRQPFLDFLKGMEQFLFSFFEEESQVVDNEWMLNSHAIIDVPRFYEFRKNVPCVELAFKSGVYRLLTHGLCQFHGFTSKSFDDKLTKRRMTRIFYPKYDPLLAGWETVDEATCLGVDQTEISLVEYLCTT